MAYDQYGQYQTQSRPYYNQQAPRNAPREGPRGRGGQPYMNQSGGYSQDRQNHSQNPHESYQGYDGDGFWDQYEGEGDMYGYNQQYQQGGYGQQHNYNQGYGSSQQQRGPQPFPREQMQRRDDYGSRPRGYSNGMNGQMGPPQGGRGRGPPQNGYGPPQGAMQGYDGQRQMSSPQSNTPPRQKNRLVTPISPRTMGFDNPFPVFPSQSSKPKNDMELAEQAMAGVDLNGRPSQDSKRPPTSGSSNSQNSSRSNYTRYPLDPRAERAPRSSEERYGPRPSLENRGPPQRSMTLPQDIEYPANNRRINQEPNPWPNANYDVAGYGPGRQDPVQQRSFTSLGDRLGPTQAPQRPSTATGTRPPPNMYPNQRGNYSAADFGARLGPQANMPPRPGTSQGNYGSTSQPNRPPMRSRDSELDAWMPNFDAQPAHTQPLQDAIGLPLDAAPEAIARSATTPSPVGETFPQQVQKAKSQPDLRGQANGHVYGAAANSPAVPKMPPLMAGTLSRQGRSPPRPLATNVAQVYNTGMGNNQVASPISPRQFHRPGAPPIVRNETAQSGWSDPGPGTANKTFSPMNNTPISQRSNGLPANPAPKPANPDALPAHPVPVRPGLMQGNGPMQARPAPARQYGEQPGPAQIRQAQVKRQSIDSTRASISEKQASLPVTHEEISRLRETVKSNPSDYAKVLFFAKRLVEAAAVLAPEGGRVDARTAQKNRENYIFEAHKQVKRLVSANYPDAMFYLADCYGTGLLGLAVDPKEAFSLYQGAAKLGHAPSAYRTAVCCEMGQEAGGGTRKDPLKAVQWYRRAASLGDVPAMYKLGMILLKGLLGQQQSLGESMIWLQRAADRADEENPHALHELALIYENAPKGGKVIRDEAYALQLYEKAAKFGYRASQCRLGKAYEFAQLGCLNDNRSSIHWYSKAAAQEDHEAELALSGWYLTGCADILKQSDTEAYLWARKAALAETPKAEYAMGYFSEVGIGCPQSLENAKRWYGRAAAHKYPKAQQRLEELIRGGSRGMMKNRERISRSDTKKHEECTIM